MIIIKDTSIVGCYWMFVCVCVCLDSITSSPSGRGRWGLRPGRGWEQQWRIPLDPDCGCLPPLLADSLSTGTDEAERGEKRMQDRVYGQITGTTGLL